AVAETPPRGAEPTPAGLRPGLADAARAQDREESLCAEVEGTAPAGSEVMVDGTLAAIADDGRFGARAPAAAGKTGVLVAIRDAGGRGATRTIPRRTNRRMPPHKGLPIP